MRAVRDAWLRVSRALPRGQTLPDREWASRHRAMLWILRGHVIALPVFLFVQGFGVWGSIAPVLPMALATWVGNSEAASRRARSVAVVIGLLTASAVLVYGWHGQIEGHFHYFVMIALLALYEDWLPFGLAVTYVAVQHGVLGAIAPHAVYNHSGSAWLWAGIHGGFVLAAGAASVATWQLNEDTRARLVAAHHSARKTAERFRLAFESAISGMAMQAPDGQFLRVNTALCEMLGYSESELLRLKFQDVTHPDDVGKDAAHRHSLVDGTLAVYETEKRYRHRDGSVVWVRLGVSAVRDESDQVEYFISQTNDITKRKHFEEELAHRALHDPLTGLPNRTLFFDRLTRAVVLRQRRPGKLAVLFIDLDRFKLVNDGMGHGVGDAVLLEAAIRLSGAVRAGDTVARFGGDEFTIVCEDADQEEACQIAERVLTALGQPFEHEGRTFRLGASVGIRVTERIDVSAEALLQDADVALYSAKGRGRGCFELFDDGMETRGFDLLEAEQDLRHAIGAGELRLHYQPEVVLASGRIVALEALVRWEHPERGLMPPAHFIPLAEDSGLIVELGDWVMRHACAQLAAWRKAGLVDDQLRVAINISPRQLSDPRLLERVTGALTACGLKAAALSLEVTESALVEDSDAALANLEAIKELGVAIALDDFGVGFSSLSRIRELPPVDMIKIDRSFVAGFGRNRADRAVVSAVVSLAAHLGVMVVAEGIEDQEQLDASRELGCDLGQGYLFARPQPADQLTDLLADRFTRGAEPHLADCEPLHG